MDARHERERQIKAALGSRIENDSRTWTEYFWGPKKREPLSATDAATKQFMHDHFTHLLDHTEPPDTFKPTQVAELITPKELRSLGYEKAEDALPAIYELAFEQRAFGNCEILRKGVIFPESKSLRDLDGPIKIRRKADL